MYWFPSRKPSTENDDREIGPYPQFPHASSDPAGSAQFRPADLPAYFDRQNRRKFGEAVPEEAEFQGMWNVDIEGDYSVVYMLSGFVLLFGTVGTIAYLNTKYHDPMKSPRLLAVEKELPFQKEYFKGPHQPVHFWSGNESLQVKQQ